MSIAASSEILGEAMSKKKGKQQVDSELVEKYRCYEAAVQDPHQQITIFKKVYNENFKEEPRVLREDFSGSFYISSEWVKKDKNRTAIAVDIEAETHAVGKELRNGSLTDDEWGRIKLLEQDVLKPIDEKVDVVAVCNFSYFIFHQRQTLVEYFSSVRKSFNDKGIFVLETAGGPGFEETPLREKRSIKKEKQTSKGEKKEKKWFKYTWHQKSFDPIHRKGIYNIHFDFADGRKMKEAFVYDWRIWTIPEVADILMEVGFDEVQVYWELDDPDDDGYAIYERQATADNDYHTWIAYIAGIVR